MITTPSICFFFWQVKIGFVKVFIRSNNLCIYIILLIKKTTNITSDVLLLFIVHIANLCGLEITDSIPIFHF